MSIGQGSCVLTTSHGFTASSACLQFAHVVQDTPTLHTPTPPTSPFSALHFFRRTPFEGINVRKSCGVYKHSSCNSSSRVGEESRISLCLPVQIAFEIHMDETKKNKLQRKRCLRIEDKNEKKIKKKGENKPKRKWRLL